MAKINKQKERLLTEAQMCAPSLWVLTLLTAPGCPLGSCTALILCLFLAGLTSTLHTSMSPSFPVC